MFRSILTIVFALSLQVLGAQTTVSGQVIEKPGLPIIGANIFIEGSYDGTVSDGTGTFSFTTTLTGEQTISISYLGYESKTMTADVGEMSDLTIKLRESASTLDAVEISASTFKAGDNSKLAVLKPLDMVTTAGSMGDVMAAIQSLPGTQSNPDDGRLFVRGGDASETQIFIDGMRVFSPYTRTIQGTPSRGRFSPFLFKGVSFSTGGYDAEYGQALSGILDMNTIDEPNQTETNISLMTVGLALGHTKKKEKSSVSFSASYIDLTPYYWLAPTRLDFNTPFRGFSGELVHRYKLGDGLLKTYIAGDMSLLNINVNDLNTGLPGTFDLKNINGYVNSTYASFLTEKTSYKLGAAYGVNRDRSMFDEFDLDTDLDGLHLKANLKTVFSDFLIFDYGVDLISISDGNRTAVGTTILDERTTDRMIPGVFGSLDYFVNKNLAFNLGLRYEHNSLMGTNEIDPRLTLAYKLGKNSQMSAAYGQYNQEVNPEFTRGFTVLNEKSRHYLLNYNYKDEKSIIRLEGYYKDYLDLVTFEERDFTFQDVANQGSGRAYGFDAFWRSSKLIKYMDFWVSYSWLNNERKHRDFPTFATPAFSTTHNLSIVTKRWFENLKSQLGVTYAMTSGRPYDDPSTPAFMTERSGLFHNVSVSWAYLISQQKILFVSVSNLPRFRNEFGYRYADAPDATGRYASELIRPNDDSFFFVGFFITMSKDKMKNQLDSL
jgi:outer membrane cobalamin receptor